MYSPIKIPVSSDKYALVDASEAGKVKQYRWSIYTEHDGKMYAHANVVVNGKRHRIMLASFITLRKRSEVIVYRNNNPLDCRRDNLLVLDRKRYLRQFGVPNGRKRTDKASGYTGVRYLKGKGGMERWEASIRPRGRLIYLGRYASEKEAARAYDVAALRHYGTVARLNFPDQVVEPAPTRISDYPAYRLIHCARCGRPLRVTNPRQKNCRIGGCLRPVKDNFEVEGRLV